MRMVALLISLLLIGLLIYQQMGAGSNQAAQDLPAAEVTGTPKVPTRPGEVKQFNQQMNNYMQDTAAERAEAMDEAETGE